MKINITYLIFYLLTLLAAVPIRYKMGEFGSKPIVFVLIFDAALSGFFFAKAISP